MNDTILSIDTPEGTYQLNCLVPNPNNKEPAPAQTAEVSFTDANGNLAKRFKKPSEIQRPYRPLMVSAIEEVVSESEDGDEATDSYNVLCLPIPESHYHQTGTCVRVKIDREQVLRVYETVSPLDINEEIGLVLNPPADEELTRLNAQLLAGAGPALPWLFSRLRLVSSKLELIKEEINETLNPTPEAPDAEATNEPDDANV